MAATRVVSLRARTPPGELAGALPNLAGPGVRITCAESDNLTLNVWDGDKFVGAVVIGNEPIVEAAPAVEADAPAPLEEPRMAPPIVAESNAAYRTSPLRDKAIAFAAKRLPPSVKTAIKKHIWSP